MTVSHSTKTMTRPFLHKIWFATLLQCRLGYKFRIPFNGKFCARYSVYSYLHNFYILWYRKIFLFSTSSIAQSRRTYRTFSAFIERISKFTPLGHAIYRLLAACSHFVMRVEHKIWQLKSFVLLALKVFYGCLILYAAGVFTAAILLGAEHIYSFSQRKTLPLSIV